LRVLARARDGDIVAYKAIQPSGCTLKWKLDPGAAPDLTLPASSLAKKYR